MYHCNCLTKNEKSEFEYLLKQHKRNRLIVDSKDLEYMVAKGMIKISKAICDFDVRYYNTIDYNYVDATVTTSSEKMERSRF